MDTVRIVERDIAPAELARLHAGFDEHALAHGVEVQHAERLAAVALDDARFVGAASALAYKNGSAYAGWCYLSDLFVERSHRGRGVGSRLLRVLERALASKGVARIWTWTAAHEAPEFYTKRGYVVFAELEGWYSDGGSRIGLRKELAEARP